MPQSSQAVTVGKEQAFTRHEFFFGAAAVTEIRLVYCNYLAAGEVANNGTLTIDAAIELDDGIVSAQGFTFSGASAATIAAGGQVISDALKASAFGLTAFPANSKFWIRTNATTTATSWLYSLPVNTTRGEQAFVATKPFASPALSTGQVTGLTGQTNVTGAMQPSLILGKTSASIPGIIFIGDSITVGINDTGVSPIYGRGTSGRMNSLYNGNAIIPYINLGAAGEGANGATGANGFTNRSVFLGYGDRAIVAYGVNDMKSGTQTAAQTLANNLTICGWLKNAGIKYVFLATITAYTSSTDSWATTVNQTDLGNGSVILAYNSLLASLSDSRVDGIVDYGGTLRDPGTPIDWLTPGYTSDGLHPLGTGHALLGPLARTAVQSKGTPLAAPDYSWVR